MSTDVYTQTLTSGQVLTVSLSIDFGEIIIAGLLAGLLAALIFSLLYKRVYGSH